MRSTSVNPLRINVERESDLTYWADRFGVPTFELRRAVDRAGPAVADVRKSLKSFRPARRVEA